MRVIAGTLLALALAPGAPNVIATRPELPRVILDTRMPARTGRTVTLRAGDDLQAALNKAQPGDEIVLQARATFTGGFMLPLRKGGALPGTGAVITIRTSDIAALPEGRRVQPSDSMSMARIVVPQNGMEAITTAPGTSGFRIVGVEITAAPSVNLVSRLVRLGDGSNTQHALDAVPQNIVLDRTWIHVGPKVDIRRCVDLHSGASAIIDSYIAGCHSANGDAQAILMYNGPGPYRIMNNYLEGSGENVMVGGADPFIPKMIPSDIEIRRNHFFKPMSWKIDDPSYAGKLWTIKNLFELKMGERVLVEANVFENSWVSAQVGFALLLKTTNDVKPALTTKDITVRSNLIRGAAGGVNVAGIDGLMFRVLIDNNLFLDIDNPKWGENGRLFQATNVEDLTITHNTGFVRGTMFGLEPPDCPRLTFTDNLVGHGQYGIKAGGVGIGSATLAKVSPGYTFTGNVVVGGESAVYPPGNNFVRSALEVGWADPTASFPVIGPKSLYARRGANGTTAGADGAALEKAVEGVTSPRPTR